MQTPAGYAEGLITETEAYGGWRDGACHAHLNRRTTRTEIMFAPGGVAYVYLCYGLHYLFNIITGPADSPQAVLVRAVQITAGAALVRQRRPGVREADWSSGPGRVCAALGIGSHHYGIDLTGETIWLEDRHIRPAVAAVRRTPRIGVDYAGVWAQKPWRFVWSAPRDRPTRPTPVAGKIIRADSSRGVDSAAAAAPAVHLPVGATAPML